jgi:hypothetical protein
MQLWQYCLLITARSLYMFRTLSTPIIRSTNNTAKVASCWFFIQYGLMMHGNSNIKFCEEFSDGNRTAITKTIYITKQGYGYVNAKFV